jgi:ribonuclease E
MTTENEDDWAELARELERYQPSVADPTPSESAHALTPEAAENEAGFADDIGEQDESDENISPDSSAPSLEGEDNLPGSGRKRRRRRRRRRKSGAGEAIELPTETNGTDTVSTTEPTDLVQDSADVSSSYEDDSESESPIEVTSADGDDDIGGEVLRDLIANWNVPSWDDVVAGLYRPDR